MELGGVYMTHRGDFRPGASSLRFGSHGSLFVYMIPPQNVMPVRVTLAWVNTGSHGTGESIEIVVLSEPRRTSARNFCEKQSVF